MHITEKTIDNKFHATGFIFLNKKDGIIRTNGAKLPIIHLFNLYFFNKNFVKYTEPRTSAIQNNIYINLVIIFILLYLACISLIISIISFIRLFSDTAAIK